jgi:hypothetical protein
MIEARRWPSVLMAAFAVVLACVGVVPVEAAGQFDVRVGIEGVQSGRAEPSVPDFCVISAAALVSLCAHRRGHPSGRSGQLTATEAYPTLSDGSFGMQIDRKFNPQRNP